MADHALPWTGATPFLATGYDDLRQAVARAREHGEVTWLTGSQGQKIAAIVPPGRVRQDASSDQSEADAVARIAQLFSALAAADAGLADAIEDALGNHASAAASAGSIDRWLRYG